MEFVQLTNAQVLKAEKRFLRSPFQNEHRIKSIFAGTDFYFRGLWRTGSHWILSKDPNERENFFLQEISQGISHSSSAIPSPFRKEPVKIELIKVSDLNYDDRIFQPMKTGEPIDYMFSSDGGIYPATNYMVIGDPGIGKSTQTLDILAKIVQNDPDKKVLFVSGEMNQIDMYGYVKRYPAFGQIPTLFLCDYLDEDTKSVIEETYKQGWDLILIDSFIEVQEAVQSSSNISRTQAEKWMIDMMISNNKGNNDENRFTSFLAIQQVTKGGNFVGSNKLKHNTTGMIELRFSSEFSGDRYAKVTKNRRGFKYERIYFSLENPLTVEYDKKRIERDEEIKQRLQKEKEILLSEEDQFKKIFGSLEEDSEEEI